MKKICVWGTSLRKVADEAQVIAFIRIIKHKFPETEITLFSMYGESVTELMLKEGFKVKTIRTSSVFKIIQALARSDIFVIEGGPFYEELAQVARCFFLCSVAKIFHLPIIAYGVTAFHFKTWWGRFLFRDLFNRMDVVTARERVAVDILKDLKIKKDIALFADPRFVLEPRSSDEVQEILVEEGINIGEPLIGITTRYLHQNIPTWVKRSHHYTDERVKKANEAIAKTIADLGDFAQLLLIPMHPDYNDDMATAKIIQGYMKNPSRLRIASRRYHSITLMNLISRCELLFAGRLGSAVFATITATPVIAIAYEPRMVDHMDRIGYGQNVFDWKNLKYEELTVKAKEIWQSRNSIKESMKAKVKEFRELAWENAKIISEFT